jgi:rare lipoprotein A
MMAHLGASICGAAILLAHPSAEFPLIGTDYSYAAEKIANIDSTPERGTDHANANGAIDFAAWPKNAASLLAPLTDTGPDLKRNAVARGPSIVGVASMYNPYRPGNQEGGTQTASGESYDPAAWTAAIQTDLREQFGGVRYGKDYRPTYALVESADRQVVIKINDVGSLKAGRVIDFNEQTMRYFDPTLELGLIDSVTITPLLGDDWSPGPIQKNS